MSSISAHTPFCGISLYTATKSYLRTMTKAFRLEMKEFGVRVMVVCPGAVATDLYRLPKNLQQLGVNLGVIYRPEKLVKKALYKLFYTNTKEFIPGIINRLFKPIYAILPEWFKMWARKKTASLKK
jgi:short-subunit dehydrogenase